MGSCKAYKRKSLRDFQITEENRDFQKYRDLALSLTTKEMLSRILVFTDVSEDVKKSQSVEGFRKKNKTNKDEMHALSSLFSDRHTKSRFEELIGVLLPAKTVKKPKNTKNNGYPRVRSSLRSVIKGMDKLKLLKKLSDEGSFGYPDPKKEPPMAKFILDSSGSAEQRRNLLQSTGLTLKSILGLKSYDELMVEINKAKKNKINQDFLKQLEESYKKLQNSYELKEFDPTKILSDHGFHSDDLRVDRKYKAISPQIREQIVDYIATFKGNETQKFELMMALKSEYPSVELKKFQPHQLLAVLIKKRDFFGPFMLKNLQQEGQRLQGKTDPDLDREIIEAIRSSQERIFDQKEIESLIEAAKKEMNNENYKIKKLIKAGSLAVVFELEDGKVLKWIPPDVQDKLENDRLRYEKMVQNIHGEIQALQAGTKQTKETKEEIRKLLFRKKTYDLAIEEIEQIKRETDLYEEAEKTKMLARSYGYVHDGSNLKIKVIQASHVPSQTPGDGGEISYKTRFNVQELAEGKSLSDYLKDNIDDKPRHLQVQRTMHALTERHLTAIFSGQPFHADLHEGNIILEFASKGEGDQSEFVKSLQIIDAGSVGQLSKLEMSAFLKVSQLESEGQKISKDYQHIIGYHAHEISKSSGGSSDDLPDDLKGFYEKYKDLEDDRKLKVKELDAHIRHYMQGFMGNKNNITINAHDVTSYHEFLEVFVAPQTLAKNRAEMKGIKQDAMPAAGAAEDVSKVMSDDYMMRRLYFTESSAKAFKTLSTARAVAFRINRANEREAFKPVAGEEIPKITGLSASDILEKIRQKAEAALNGEDFEKLLKEYQTEQKKSYVKPHQSLEEWYEKLSSFIDVKFASQDDLINYYRELKQKVDDKGKKIEELKDENSALASKKKEAEEAQVAFHKEKVTLEGKISNLNSELEKKKEELASKEDDSKKLSGLKQKITELEDEKNKALEGLTKKLESKDGRISELEQNIEGLKKEILKAKGEMKQYQGESLASINNAKEGEQAKKAQIDALNQKILSYHEEEKKLKKKVQELNDSRQKDQKDMNAKLQALTEEKKQLEAKNKTSFDSLEEQKQRFEEKLREVEGLKQKLEEYEGKIDDQKENSEDLKQALIAVQAEEKKQLSLFEDKKNELLVMVKKFEEANFNLKKLQQDLTSKDGENLLHKEKLKEQEKELRELQTELKKYQQDVGLPIHSSSASTQYEPVMLPLKHSSSEIKSSIGAAGPPPGDERPVARSSAQSRAGGSFYDPWWWPYS